MEQSFNTPPASRDYEKVVLSCMLLDKKAIEICIELLEPSCFYYPEYQIMFNAICGLYEAQKEADQLTIEEFLKERKQLEEAGGPEMIASVATEANSTAGIKDYCGILIKYGKRRKLLTLGRSIQLKAMEDGADSDHIIEDAQGMMNSIGLSKTPEHKLLKDLIPEAYEELNKRKDKDISSIGIPSGFGRLDKVINNLRKGSLVILAAKTSQGKTAMALDISRNVAKTGMSVLYVSLETPAKDLAIRLIGNESRAEVSSIQYREFQEPQEEQLFWTAIGDGCNRLQKYPIIIEDMSALGLNRFYAKVEKHIREYDIKLVLVDYLQLLTGTNNESRRLEIESLSRGLKRIAMQCNIPIIALSQLSRNIDHRGEEHRPVLSDLRESGSIEQDSDIVLFIHNASKKQKLEYDLHIDEPVDENDPYPQIRELIIRKNRNGNVGTIFLLWQKEYARFQPLDY